jgi:hypothetical protein
MKKRLHHLQDLLSKLNSCPVLLTKMSNSVSVMAASSFKSANTILQPTTTTNISNTPTENTPVAKQPTTTTNISNTPTEMTPTAAAALATVLYHETLIDMPHGATWRIKVILTFIQMSENKKFIRISFRYKGDETHIEFTLNVFDSDIFRFFKCRLHEMNRLLKAKNDHDGILDEQLYSQIFDKWIGKEVDIEVNNQKSTKSSLFYKNIKNMFPVPV